MKEHDMKAINSKTGLRGMLNLLAGAAVASVVAVASASATPIDLGGYTGPLDIKFNNYESFTSSTLAPGTQNYGIFTVQSIYCPGCLGNLWTPGGASGYLVGTFDDITVQSATGVAPTITTENTGGSFALYYVSTPPANFTTGYTFTQYNGGTCTNSAGCYAGLSNPILTYNLVPGIDAADPLSTLQADINSTTVPITGSADAYANITGGSDASQFATGGFTTALLTSADLYIQDNFCANQKGCNGATAPIGKWQELSDDPVATATASVPEPASIAFLGAGLLGLGMLYRRRQRRSA
jgi:hypothetical protein